MNRLATGPTVYRLFGADGRLIYVGATEHLHRRMREHKHRSIWWRWAVRSTITRYPTRAEAEAAEAAAIRDEASLFNVRGRAPAEAAA